MKKVMLLGLLVLMNCNFVFADGGLRGLSPRPMPNCNNPNNSWINNVPFPRQGGCLPMPGLYVNPPYQNYYYLPYTPYLGSQEKIPVQIVSAEGLNISDGRYRRVQFYIGQCLNGQTWCQAGVTPARFPTEFEALRWIERCFCLRDMSMREIERRSTGSPWYISN